MQLKEAVDQVISYAKESSPAIIFLEGNLGAGKTHFTNQLAREVGVTRHLPSPTFTFLQEYTCDWEGKRNIIHCDLYRMEPEKAEQMLEQIGFWDYIQPHSILFIEWPEKAHDHIKDLPHKSLRITFNEQGERNYEFS